MLFGYVRVSTEKQNSENQKFEIENFCRNENLKIDLWIEETISGTKEPGKRKLGQILHKMKKDDILVCTELSRLGRSLLMIMGFLNEALKKEIKIITIKDNYRLGSDINSKVLAFAFSLSAEIERNLISQRTIEALARKKAEGITLGHPKGTKNQKSKIRGHEPQILKLRKSGASYSKIAKKIHVHPITISRFFKNNGHLF